MPKIIDETGNKYNNLIVVGLDKIINGRKIWLCRCQICQREYSISGTQLRNNKTINDCPYCEKVGKIYGRLKVLAYSHQTSDRHNYWLCQCECGNQEIIKASRLNTGERTQCLICNKQNRKSQYIDETGNKYGRLTVIELDKERSGKLAFWKCRCDCGTITTVSGIKLRDGHTQSCGCLVSAGEAKISQILSDANISFKKEITFTDCKDKHNLRFDFGVYDNKTNQLLYLIEFDGIQHFKSTGDWSTEEHLHEVQRRDKIKNIYCQNHNIPLIRIPYYHLKQLVLEDLTLKSKFLISLKEN